MLSDEAFKMFIRSLIKALDVKFGIYANDGEEEVHDTFNDAGNLGGYPNPTFHKYSSGLSFTDPAVPPGEDYSLFI